jgi:anti-anti-sigma factor
MTLTLLAPFTRTVPGLVVSVSAEGAATVIALRGEADPAVLPVLVDVLVRVIADHDGAVVVDLAQTEFIDTATVRVIGRAGQFLGDRGRQLTLRSPSRLAVHVLGFGGLSHLVEPDRATA